MSTHYTRSLRYVCQRRALDYAAAPCQSLAGASLEQLVCGQVLEVVTPAGLELSRCAAQERQGQRAALDRQWQLRRERAAQEANRASRQYNAVEPENRLVARSLERAWEEALLAQRTVEEDYHRFQQTQPVPLSPGELAEIETLAHNLPALWQAPTTSVMLKRHVVRLLLQRVVVWAPARSHEVTVQLHWSHGKMTEHRITRAVRSWEQIADAAVIWQRVQGWQAAGWTSRRMAQELNAAGHRTPRGQPFTAESVRQLLARGGPHLATSGAGTDRHAPKCPDGTSTR